MLMIIVEVLVSLSVCHEKNSQIFVRITFKHLFQFNQNHLFAYLSTPFIDEMAIKTILSINCPISLNQEIMYLFRSLHSLPVYFLLLWPINFVIRMKRMHD